MLPGLVTLLLAVEPQEFSNGEIRVDFGSAFSARAKAGATVYRETFPSPVQTVDFCQWQPQPPEVQQVMRPETGYLCELHILPALNTGQVRALVEKAARTQRADHGRTFRIAEEDIGAHKVVRWRFQAGKSRLDHFLVTGKKFSYLFVSSPYGSNGEIERIIRQAFFGQ